MPAEQREAGFLSSISVAGATNNPARHARCQNRAVARAIFHAIITIQFRGGAFPRIDSENFRIVTSHLLLRGRKRRWKTSYLLAVL